MQNRWLTRVALLASLSAILLPAGTPLSAAALPKETLSIDLRTPGHPLFKWAAIPGASGYGIELLKANAAPLHANDTIADPNRLAVGVTQAPVTTWLGDTAGLSLGTYTVRAIAWNGGGFVSVFSDPVTFTVAPPWFAAPGALTTALYTAAIRNACVIAGSTQDILITTTENATVTVVITFADGTGDFYGGITASTFFGPYHDTWAVPLTAPAGFVTVKITAATLTQFATSTGTYKIYYPDRGQYCP